MPAQKPFDLLVIGELNMDMIMDNVESFPELGKEKIASGLTLTLGSSSAIFASNAARLGARTTFCGMVGRDDFGDNVLRNLQAHQVDTSLLRQSEEHQTGLTVIIRHRDDRAMVTYPGAMEHFSLQDIPDEAFTQARHLHISSIFLQPGIKRDLVDIIRRARAQNMTVSLDSQWDPAEQWDLDIPALAGELDFFLPNEAEFLNYMKTATVIEGLRQLQPTDCTVVVKRGRRGATYLSGSQIETLPAFPNNRVADAVGAGDSFNAGFIYQFLQGHPIAQCVRFGNLTGAVSTTRAGGTAAITSLTKTLEIAKEKLSITDTDDFTR